MQRSELIYKYAFSHLHQSLTFHSNHWILKRHTGNAPMQPPAPEPVPIPVIDFDCLQQHNQQRTLVIKDIGRACQKLGCFQVKNHGINQSVIKGAIEVSSSFFELPPEVKLELASEDVTKPVRYGSSSIQNERCFLKHYGNPINEWIGLWPPNPPDYREKMAKYTAEVQRVAMQLIGAILESLGLGPAYLREKLEEGMQVLAVNCYQQSCEKRESLLGLAPHTDFGCITILVQSCPGLQFVDKNSESWRAINEVSGTLHVHTGDYLEVMSNGLYKSVVHRAVLDNRKRISIASIHSLAMDEKVSTAKELVDEQQPKGYRDSSFRDFLDFISSNSVADGKSFINSLRILGA